MKKIIVIAFLGLALLLVGCYTPPPSAISSPLYPPVTLSNRIEDIRGGRVIATIVLLPLGDTITTVVLEDGGSFALKGDVRLILGATYQFSYYGSAWHIDKLISYD